MERVCINGFFKLPIDSNRQPNVKMQFIVALNNSADTAKLNLLPTSLNTKLHHGSKVASSLASWTNGRGR